MNDFANAFKTCGFNFKIFDFVEKKELKTLIQECLERTSALWIKNLDIKVTTEMLAHQM